MIVNKRNSDLSRDIRQCEIFLLYYISDIFSEECLLVKCIFSVYKTVRMIELNKSNILQFRSCEKKLFKDTGLMVRDKFVMNGKFP